MPIWVKTLFGRPYITRGSLPLAVVWLVCLGAAHAPSVDAAEVQLSTSSLAPCTTKAGRTISTEMITLPAGAGEHQAEVGSSLLVTAQESVVETGLILTRDAIVTGKDSGGDMLLTLPATDLRTAPRLGDLVIIPNATFRHVGEKRDRRGLRKPDVGVYLDPSDPNVLMVRLLFGFIHHDYVVPNPQLERIRCLSLGTGGFRREILYSGAAKDIISLQYREYVNDTARPAFSQELTYDLANGNDIGVKGARIRIVKVSNVGVSYIVLKPLE